MDNTRAPVYVQGMASVQENEGDQRHQFRARDLGGLGVRAAILLGVWLALTGGEAAWPWGILLALAATAASVAHMPVRFGRFEAMLRFVPRAPFLLREALVSGWDVATRALHRRMRLRPAFLDVELRRDLPRLPMAVAYAVTLIPGTLAVTLTPRRVHLHVIDERLSNRERIKQVEARLAPLFENRRR